MNEIIKNNTRNSDGIKNSTDMYRTIGGFHYEHWTSGKTKQECQSEYPDDTFIVRNGEVFRLVK